MLRSFSREDLDRLAQGRPFAGDREKPRPKGEGANLDAVLVAIDLDVGLGEARIISRTAGQRSREQSRYDPTAMRR